MAQLPPILTASQVAELFDTSAETIRRWAREGKIPSSTMPSGEFADVHGQLLGITITFVGVSGKVDVNPLAWTAQNAAGDTYDAGLGDIDSGQLPSTSVTEGRRARGIVTFDVPAGQKITVVILSEVGDPVATWDL